MEHAGRRNTGDVTEAERRERAAIERGSVQLP
jgi:hypothetical protein